MSSRIENLKQRLADRNAEREPSPLENWVCRWMSIAHLYGYETEYQVDWFFIDIAWPDIKLAVELDGYEFHKDKKDRDARRDAFLSERGWRVYRIPSKEAWNPKHLAEHLAIIKGIVDPGSPLPFGLAELLGQERHIYRHARHRDTENEYAANCKACDVPIARGSFCPICKPIYE